eukprot:3246077-Pleurochrysis_carterae.AAC.5
MNEELVVRAWSSSGTLGRNIWVYAHYNYHTIPYYWRTTVTHRSLRSYSTGFCRYSCSRRSECLSSHSWVRLGTGYSVVQNNNTSQCSGRVKGSLMTAWHGRALIPVG